MRKLLIILAILSFGLLNAEDPLQVMKDVDKELSAIAAKAEQQTSCCRDKGTNRSDVQIRLRDN